MFSTFSCVYSSYSVQQQKSIAIIVIIVARKSSFSSAVADLIHLGLTTYLVLDAQSKQSMAKPQASWQMPLDKSKEIERDLFPNQRDRVQQFRTQLQAEANSKGKSPHPKVKISKDFRERARSDYESARGTIHRRLLLDIEPTLQVEARKVYGRVAALEDEAHQLEAERDTELHRAVVRPIVERELATLTGIGPRLAEAIQKQVFTGDLESLRWAFRVEGIGPQKQAMINAWIDKQTLQLPGLLNEPFPEKVTIAAGYEQKIGVKEADLDKAKTYQNKYRDMLQHAYDELDWLMSVTLRDFETAFGEGVASHQLIARYLLGVFPPWEAMPDWFTQAIEISAQSAAPPPSDLKTASNSVN